MFSEVQATVTKNRMAIITVREDQVAGNKHGDEARHGRMSLGQQGCPQSLYYAVVLLCSIRLMSCPSCLFREELRTWQHRLVLTRWIPRVHSRPRWCTDEQVLCLISSTQHQNALGYEIGVSPSVLV